MNFTSVMHVTGRLFPFTEMYKWLSYGNGEFFLQPPLM
jgi:hypothetical protein